MQSKDAGKSLVLAFTKEAPKIPVFISLGLRWYPDVKLIIYSFRMRNPLILWYSVVYQARQDK